MTLAFMMKAKHMREMYASCSDDNFLGMNYEALEASNKKIEYDVTEYLQKKQEQNSDFRVKRVKELSVRVITARSLTAEGKPVVQYYDE